MTTGSSGAPWSGEWRGWYEQFGRRYPQAQRLEFADGIVRGDGADLVGEFVLEGRYRADGSLVRLGWIKTYRGGHSVLYLGELSGDAMQGRWELEFSGSGEFGFVAAPAGGAS